MLQKEAIGASKESHNCQREWEPVSHSTTKFHGLKIMYVDLSDTRLSCLYMNNYLYFL